jgi:hypothetical protein
MKVPGSWQGFRIRVNGTGMIYDVAQNKRKKWKNGVVASTDLSTIMFSSSSTVARSTPVPYSARDGLSSGCEDCVLT